MSLIWKESKVLYTLKASLEGTSLGTSKVISIIYVFISFTIFCDKPEQTRPILHVTL